MKTRILALSAALAASATLTGLPVASAQADSGTGQQVVCPAGTTDPLYCADLPTGSASGGGQVSATTATSSGRTVLPQGSPAVYHWELWGAKLNVHTGPALKFDLHSGVNGAPALRSFRLELPKGLAFALPVQGAGIAFDRRQLVTNPRSLTVNLRNERPTLAIYIKNRSLVESARLRAELAAGTVTTLSFKLVVTDAAGRATDLTFAVKPQG